MKMRIVFGLLTPIQMFRHRLLVCTCVCVCVRVRVYVVL